MNLKQELRLARPSLSSRRSAESELELDTNIIDISDEGILEGNNNRKDEDMNIEASSAIPPHMKVQVEVQTPDGTPIGDILLTPEQSIQELRAITENMEKELEEITNSYSKRQDNNGKVNARKKGYIKEKKRKREEEEYEEDTDEDEEPSVCDGEKVFMRFRTSKLHYHEIVKEMEHIKGILPALIVPSMIDWILACEIRRSKSKNINGTVARQMREYLIKLYCAVGEIQKQKDNSEAEKLREQVENMKKNMIALQKENINLRRELEVIKKKIAAPAEMEEQETARTNRIPSEGAGRNRRKSSSSVKGMSSKKKNSQPTVILLERRNRNIKIRRELSYPMDIHNTSRTEDDEQGRDFNISQLMGKRKDNLAKQNTERKGRKRLNSVESSNKKSRDTGKPTGNRKEQADLWTKVIGRKERRRSNREEARNRYEKGNREDKTKLRRPLKTSAVVITTEDRSISYSEVLAWARQTVKLSEEEVNAINTKRSATGGILLEIKGEKNRNC